MQSAAALNLNVTVIVTAYTEARWGLTCSAVESVLEQTRRPWEIIVCVDHNPSLLARFAERWPAENYPDPVIRVIASQHEGHVAGSRTTAMELATSPLLVFLDDDASAPKDWLAQMCEPFREPDVVAVGGRPVPIYESSRPRWFPYEFDWVFGCAYRGLPQATAPVRRVIGTTMAARRDALVTIDGFYFDVFEDMAMCHLLLERFPNRTILYLPSTTVKHHVPADRVTWKYFWRRCYWVNHGKVAVMKELGNAGDLTADRSFVAATLRSCLEDALRGALRRDSGGLQRLGAAFVGLGAAAVGYGIGSLKWRLHVPATWPTGRRPPSA